MDLQHSEWIDSVLPRHNRLTGVVISLMENLLKSSSVDYLTISGRTKERDSALEKINRKGYKDPSVQMTDLSGIRIVVFLESQIQQVTDIIINAFGVDEKNSLNRDALMSVDQTGYRSVHFVCDLGDIRAALPEFDGLSGLKFELQIRTVLQHAWAELAHDRNYKFSGKLPREMERKLYLYAGMLEIADKGFDELSNQIDSYVVSLEKVQIDDFVGAIDSINLEQFVSSWAEREKFELEYSLGKDVPDLVRELWEFDVLNFEDLRKIIPNNFSSISNEINYSTNIYGLVRDWMLIDNWRKFVSRVRFDWVLGNDGTEIIGRYLGDEMDELHDFFDGRLNEL